MLSRVILTPRTELLRRNLDILCKSVELALEFKPGKRVLIIVLLLSSYPYIIIIRRN